MALKQMEVEGELVNYIEEEFISGVTRTGEPVKETARYVIKENGFDDKGRPKCAAVKHMQYPNKGMALVDVDCATGKTIVLSPAELEKRAEDTKKMLNDAITERQAREKRA